MSARKRTAAEWREDALVVVVVVVMLLVMPYLVGIWTDRGY